MSERRPRALLALGSQARDQAFPADVLASLTDLVDVRDFTGPALTSAEVIVTGWGGPALDAAALARAPRLRLVVHTGGSVKEAGIAPEVWQRGIEVTSTAGVNAVNGLAMDGLSGRAISRGLQGSGATPQSDYARGTC